VVGGADVGSSRKRNWVSNAQRDHTTLWWPSTSAISRRASGICSQTESALMSGVAGSRVVFATMTFGCDSTRRRCGGLLASDGHPTQSPTPAVACALATQISVLFDAGRIPTGNIG
jgi:hypothetical protein